MPTELEIAEALRRMNAAHCHDSARAVGFRFWFDDAIQGHEASVLWELETPEQDTWPLERTDDLCQRVADALAPLAIANVYCAYRSAEDPPDESDFAYWPRVYPVARNQGGGLLAPEAR